MGLQLGEASINAKQSKPIEIRDAGIEGSKKSTIFGGFGGADPEVFRSARPVRASSVK